MTERSSHRPVRACAVLRIVVAVLLTACETAACTSGAGAQVLGQVLRDFREGTGLTQEKLGFAAKVTKNYVSDVEGARRNPTVRVLTQVLDALGVSWAEFGDAYDAARRRAKG